jgi:hypothetical protein
MAIVLYNNLDEDELEYDENYNEDLEEDLLNKAFTSSVNITDNKPKEEIKLSEEPKKVIQEKPKEDKPKEEKPKEEKAKKNKLDVLFSDNKPKQKK